ncbi:hypothetical protein H0A66_04310 [Alcaligenaceae bacterium]|nr:hypothetical protein [Alcaligenaceae bacterium]
MEALVAQFGSSDVVWFLMTLSGVGGRSVRHGVLVSASASSSRASAELAAQTAADDTPRLPFVSTRRTPTAALTCHPPQTTA